MACDTKQRAQSREHKAKHLFGSNSNINNDVDSHEKILENQPYAIAIAIACIVIAD